MLKGNAGERQQAETGLQQILRKGDPKMLRSVLEESLQREPQRNELHLFLGDLHLREGRYEDALKSYERGDQEDPLYSLARRAEEEGRYEIALRSYETLAERGKPIALYRKGVTLRKMGKEEEAIVSFQSLIEKYPNQEERLVGLYSLGMIYLENHQDPEKAISYFEEFLAQKPKVGEEVLEAKFGIVECHLMKGDFKKAEKGLLDLRETPSGDRALFCLGELYFFQEDFETASEKFNQVVERYPKSRFENDALRKILLIADYREVEGLKSLASVELMGRQGRFREGIDELKRVLNLEGGVNHRGVHTSPEPHVVQGGMSQMAQSAIGKKGLMDDALLLMGDLYEGMGDYPSAIRSYEDLVERNKESPLASEALRRAGEVFFRRLGDRKRAVETFERVLLEYPNSVQTDLIRKRVEELREEL